MHKIAALPVNDLWRHNQAGDLPGDGELIDKPKLRQLIKANHGKRGFTYSHKHSHKVEPSKFVLLNTKTQVARIAGCARNKTGKLL